MTRVIRTATIQARVLPLIKTASERVLWNIGLNMSEAIELFLRRIIVDGRIPFDVVALDADTLTVVDATARSTANAVTKRKGKSNARSQLRRPISAHSPEKN